MEGCPLFLFGTVWTEKNLIVFVNVKQMIQALEKLFVCSFMDLGKEVSLQTSMSVLEFVDWLSTFFV